MLTPDELNTRREPSLTLGEVKKLRSIISGLQDVLNSSQRAHSPRLREFCVSDLEEEYDLLGELIEKLTK